ncbi:MarR family transcriptional regulator [uncultured Clostridium sp.]|jgi:DNA-binding MarR family transcriptional regulator|uniref:MarR family transcriptional regulator n=1 Tax=uncultured Clostridium sp. TaxID=59620 RepID=UPI00261B0285|nr:MarR family transcriptional regulator [uncultured Clostridium sp.]
MNNDKLMLELIKVFQNFSEVNSRHYNSNYDDINMNEVHTIDFIGKNIDSNLKVVTDGVGITKGAIAKITKKLEEKGFISSYKKADNKKEKYFRLESKGVDVYEKHLKLHKQAFDRDKKIFDNYNVDEKKLINKFLKELANDIGKRI